MQSIGEWLLLPYIWIQVFFYNKQEKKIVHRLFYTNTLFKQVDFLLQKVYRFKNPYSICKKFMQKQRKNNIHVYGETPLSILHEALILAQIDKKDCFVDLGCGRGRLALFVASYYGVKSIGIDYIASFIEKANKLSSALSISSYFICQDFLHYPLPKEGTLFYFYSLCYEEQEIKRFMQELESLSPGTRVITVSFPLSDYSCAFSILTSFERSYPFGKTMIYINIRCNGIKSI